MPSKYFPPAAAAHASGLILVGGRLDPEWLLDAYRHGIFPWPILPNPNQIAWWSPDPRAIFELDRFHVSRRLRRTIDSGRFEVTFNRAFNLVIHGCATAGTRRGNTWITPAMRRAYLRMHELGWAHSVECWRSNQLVGGVYGVAIGGLFAGESMFHHDTDASKVALAALVEHLRARGYLLFDIQELTPHTASMGATVIPREEYLLRLAACIDLPITF